MVRINIDAVRKAWNGFQNALEYEDNPVSIRDHERFKKGVDLSIGEASLEADEAEVIDIPIEAKNNMRDILKSLLDTSKALDIDEYLTRESQELLFSHVAVWYLGSASVGNSRFNVEGITHYTRELLASEITIASLSKWKEELEKAIDVTEDEVQYHVLRRACKSQGEELDRALTKLYFLQNAESEGGFLRSLSYIMSPIVSGVPQDTVNETFTYLVGAIQGLEIPQELLGEDGAFAES